MNRKEMIKTLEAHFSVKARYMGAPSFAYQIDINGKHYIIDRVGIITTSEGELVEFDKLMNGNDEKELVADEIISQNTSTVEDKETPASLEEPSTEDKDAEQEEPLNFEVSIPMDGHTYISLRNLINMVYSKQILVKKVFEADYDIIDSAFITAINSTQIQSMEDFKKVVTQKQEHCQGIGFNFSDKTIDFKFYNDQLNQEKLEAYVQFITLLSKSAKALKYASPKPTDTDNFKFTMRVWLIRLGFNGAEYRDIRKTLLKGLEGNGAFRRLPTQSTEN